MQCNFEPVEEGAKYHVSPSGHFSVDDLLFKFLSLTNNTV